MDAPVIFTRRKRHPSLNKLDDDGSAAYQNDAFAASQAASKDTPSRPVVQGSGFPEAAGVLLTTAFETWEILMKKLVLTLVALAAAPAIASEPVELAGLGLAGSCPKCEIALG